ncbi:MAG: hypothetical protein GC178_06440 [Flavobacteriales bacterium]|nr:hypothetical protein [Flavobacteriales bacterium]
MKTRLLLPLTMFVGTTCFAQYGDYSVRVEVEGNGFAHFTQVYFEDGLNPVQSEPTLGWDPCCDANLIIANQNQPHVYTEVVEPPEPPNNPKLSINGLPHITQQTDVPMGFHPGELASYDFTFKELYTLPAGMGVTLEDLAQNVSQDLLVDSTYSTWSAPSDDELRFIIHFYPQTVTGTSGLERTRPNLKVISDGALVKISFQIEISDGQFFVYDCTGKEVYREVWSGTKSGTDMDRTILADGVYIFQAVDAMGETISKKVAFQ